MTQLSLLLLASFTVLGAEGGHGFSFFEPIQPPRKVQMMAHRGAMERAPENTAPALNKSVADTVEWVEVDVRLTRDGQHVLIHEEELAGETDGNGLVHEKPLAEILAMDAGSKYAKRFAGVRLLTLNQALELAKGRVNLYLDCKSIDPALLVREVIAAKMERQVVIYQNPEVLAKVRAAGGDGLALMTKWRPGFGFTKWIDEISPAAVEIDAVDVASEVCREFHSRGMKVQAKTLGSTYDRPEVWDRVMAAGVDWIQTDHAEEIIARRTLKRQGTDRVKISHHRGASQYAPENTLAAFEKSILLGADFVEFDVRTTRDGALMLLHDGTLDRTTTGKGKFKEKTADEIRKLDAGRWFGRKFVGAKVPTLDEFLTLVDRRVELYFDAKDIAPEALAQSLKSRGLAERTVVYQGIGYLERLRAIAPEIRRMPPLGDPSKINEIVERVQPYAFDTRWSILSKPLIERCHALGVKVFSDALGLNETVERYQKAIEDGIDLIQTDHPMRVLRALELKLKPE